MNSSSFLSQLWCLFIPTFFCVVPLIAIAWLFFTGRQYMQTSSLPDDRNIINRILLPNPAKIQQTLQLAHAQHPHSDTDQLVRQMINKAAFNAGFIGFVTGAPGLPAMPITVPLDFFATGRIQAAMIQTIAYAYDQVNSFDDEDISAKKTYLIMVGGAEGMAAVNRLIMQLVMRVVGKSVLEVIPVLGGFVGFGVNYYLTKTACELAIKHYKGQLQSINIVETTKRIVQTQKERIIPQAEQLTGRLLDAAREGKHLVSAQTKQAAQSSIGVKQVAHHSESEQAGERMPEASPQGAQALQSVSVPDSDVPAPNTHAAPTDEQTGDRQHNTQQESM